MLGHSYLTRWKIKIFRVCEPNLQHQVKKSYKIQEQNCEWQDDFEKSQYAAAIIEFTVLNGSTILTGF